MFGIAQQWGLWSQNNTYANVLFTLAYPQHCLNVIASDYNDTSNDTEGIGEALLISDVTVNGFRVSKQTTTVKTIWISLGNQQWGYTIESNGQEDYKYFPVSYNSQCYAMALGSTFNIQPDAYSWVENIDTQKFLIGLGQNYMPMPYPTIFYCSIGVQQWGDIVNDTNTFTVPFNDFCRIATTGSYSWGGYDNIIRSVELTNFTATYDDANYPFLYIAIGKQQWGSKNVTGNGSGTLLTTIKFPTAFSACWAVTANLVVTNADYDVDKYVVIGGITTSQFKVTLDAEADDTEKTFKTNWIAIGQQRIKRRRYHYRDHTTLFLQIVYRHHKYQWRHY